MISFAFQDDADSDDGVAAFLHRELASDDWNFEGARDLKQAHGYSGSKRAPVDVEKELNAEFVEQDRLFNESDFVSLHVPLNPQTRHLISKENLEKMKRTARGTFILEKGDARLVLTYMPYMRG